MLVLIDGTKYESTTHKAGDKVVIAERCIKCDGSGFYYHYGVCFSCYGSGKRHKSKKLYTPEQQQKLEERRIKRTLLREKIQAEEIQSKKQIVESLKETHAEIWSFIKDSHDAFLSSLRHHLEHGKDFSEKQLELANEVIKEEKEKPESLHIGEIGDRLEFSGKIIKVVTGQNFYGFWQIVTILCDGNQVVYKGKSYLGEKGDQVELKATIKSHDFFRDQKQTQINRPKVKETK